MKRALLIVGLAIAGCANPGIVQVSPDTYMLFREDHGGVFGSASSLKAGVISDANAFARKQGKVAIPVSTAYKPMGGGPAQWASFEYQFKVVDPNDPDVKRTSILPRPDVVVEKNERVSVDVRPKDDIAKPTDLYAELLKLDDLRKRGILSDAEFEAQKQRLLGAR